MPKKKNSSPSPHSRNGSPSTRVINISPPIIHEMKHPSMAMSVEQMAKELAIGRNVAYQLIKQPGFPSFMIGRRVVIDRKGLQEWMKAQHSKEPIVLSEEDDNA